MTVTDWLSTTTGALRNAGIETARLDALVLLEDALGTDRAYLLARQDTSLDTLVIKQLDDWTKRRIGHEPLAYIRGKTEFYGREFMVNQFVMVPRPETEAMVALATEVMGSRLQVTDKPVWAVDVGTGSGALAISLKLEYPDFEVIGIDASAECIELATKNAKKLKANVTYIKGNLLEPLYNLQTTTYNLVLANLPYVPDNYEINQAAKHEPSLAIFGGADGLDLYRQLFQQTATLSAKSVHILTESMPFQHDELAKIAKESGFELAKTVDLIQQFKRL